MPNWLSNFIIGFGIGYYALNDTVRHLINQILLTLLKLSHRLVVLLLAGILKGLNWCYKPRETVQQPIKVKSYSPPMQNPQKASVGARKGIVRDGDKVVFADGKKGVWFSDEKIAEMMEQNPDLKFSDRKDE